MKTPIRIVLILTILLIGSFYWAEQTRCEVKEKKQVNTASVKKETLSFKDPFLPALPKKKIIPKKVEQKAQVKPVAVSVKEQEKEIIPPSLAIQGLIWNTDRPQAIVNESVVGIGDMLEGAKIVGIQKTGISIVYEGKPFWIKKDATSSKSGRKSRAANQGGGLPPSFSAPPQFPEENAPFGPGG